MIYESTNGCLQLFCDLPKETISCKVGCFKSRFLKQQFGIFCFPKTLTALPDFFKFCWKTKAFAKYSVCVTYFKRKIVGCVIQEQKWEFWKRKQEDELFKTIL